MFKIRSKDHVLGEYQRRYAELDVFGIIKTMQCGS